MKKYFSFLFAAILAFTFVSCDNSTTDTITDNDTYSVAYDITDNFAVNGSGDYVITRTFNSPIPASDVILVYRKSGTDGGNTVWQQIPRTLFLTEGELDYDFDFTRNDVQIYAGGAIDLSAQSTTFKNTYLNGQTFRIVVVPASTGKVAVDYSNYYDVIRFYGIDDSNVKNL